MKTKPHLLTNVAVRETGAAAEVADPRPGLKLGRLSMSELRVIIIIGAVACVIAIGMLA